MMLVTVGAGADVDWEVKSFAFWLSSFITKIDQNNNRIITGAATIHLRHGLYTKIERANRSFKVNLLRC